MYVQSIFEMEESYVFFIYIIFILDFSSLEHVVYE